MNFLHSSQTPNKLLRTSQHQAGERLILDSNKCRASAPSWGLRERNSAWAKSHIRDDVFDRGAWRQFEMGAEDVFDNGFSSTVLLWCWKVVTFGGSFTNFRFGRCSGHSHLTRSALRTTPDGSSSIPQHPTNITFLVKGVSPASKQLHSFHCS